MARTNTKANSKSTKPARGKKRLRSVKAQSDCVIPGPVPARALPSLKVRPDPEHEQRHVRVYVEGQARNERVIHLEKVASERIFGTKHDVWDVHSNRRRWWVVTSPTNLYSQKDFPSLDYVLSFHVGLMARVSARQQKTSSERTPSRDMLLGPWRRWEQAAETLDQAEEAEDFQAVGMRCRECLIELAQALAHPSMVPQNEEAPKRADFVHWSELIACTIAQGGSTSEVRSFLKTAAKSAWQLANWLTHTRNAIRADGQLLVDATSFVLGEFTMTFIRFEKGPPDRCPSCSSYQVGVDYRPEGSRESAPYRAFSVCSRCGREALFSS